METRSSVSKKRAASHQFFCGICLEDCPNESEVSFGNCGHSFCVNCLKTYASSLIDEHSAEIKCPQMRCHAKAGYKEIGKLVSKTKLKKLKVARLKLDPLYRECDSCGKQMKFEGRSEMKCKCGVISCFLHGHLHPNETCASFEYRTKQEPETLRTIYKTTKKCPKCAVDTEKNGGCDQLVCSRCNCYWHWGKHVENAKVVNGILTQIVF